MTKAILPALALLCGLAACGEETPTSVSDDLLPSAPVTLEVRLPWDEFATGLQVFGGFGAPSDKGTGVLANAFEGVLDARTIGRWESFGLDELVADTTGTVVHDTMPRPRNPRLVIFFDTVASRPANPVTVSANRLPIDFDERTASWTHAVDSTGTRILWPEPGAGPAPEAGRGVWSRLDGDSLVVPVDTAALRAWADSVDVERGFRLDVESPNVRLELRSVELRYELVPSVNPDTTLSRTVFADELTFLYTPQPTAPESGLRVGGIPSWRSVIHVDVPEVLTGPPELCARLGCPFELTPERLNHASLVLQTAPSMPSAFQPSDTVRVDVRPVLAPDRLPRSPLGAPIAGPAGRALAAVSFRSPVAVSVPVTAFVRAQLEGTSEDGLAPPTALALLSLREPASIAFASFAGPGSAGEPYLRLIITASPVVELP